VRVNKPITEKFLEKMRNGVPILDTFTKKCEVEKIDTMNFRIVLTQGLNRQIRRMCEYLDYEVKKLKRIRIMNIKLDLPVGKWRDLTPEEMAELNGLLEDSTKTFD
jgi:23S rRNA pseudouridine2604 synthase